MGAACEPQGSELQESGDMLATVWMERRRSRVQQTQERPGRGCVCVCLSVCQRSIRWCRGSGQRQLGEDTQAVEAAGGAEGNQSYRLVGKGEEDRDSGSLVSGGEEAGLTRV